MSVMRLGCTLMAVIIVASPAAAIDADRLPVSLSARTADLGQVPVLAYPGIDLDRVLVEDAKREEEGLAPRFAIPIEAALGPLDSGLVERLDDGTVVWRVTLTSRDALSMNLGFTRFHLPPTGALWVYSTDYGQILGAFTPNDNNRHRQLWTPIVLGDTVVVEVAVHETYWPFLELELGSVNHGYTGFGYPLTERSGSCNLDVVCSAADGYPQVDDWRDQIRSVAVISTGGSTFCTGFLVNNVSGDLTPYFMTANHCGINTGNAASLVTYWKYENSTCREPGSPASGAPGDGTLTIFNTGSAFRAANSASDFTIVELNAMPPPAAEVHWAGWDATPADSEWAVAIHHPSTDEKRISFEYDPTTTTSYLGEAVPGDGTHVRVIDWDLGTTEPGSSGSPLFNQDGRVVGQLHGGYASCTSQTSDWYGRISISWEGGGSSSTRLRDWLDPAATGQTTLDGRDECTPPEFGFTISPNPSAPGRPVTVDATVTAGTGPFLYSWDFDDDGNPDCSTDPCSTTYTGYYNGTIALTVTDVGESCNATVREAMVVNAPLVRHLATGTPVELCGDGDAVVETGEEWAVPVAVENAGSVTAVNVQAGLTIGAGISDVGLTDAALDLGAVAVGAVATDTFSFIVEPSFAPCGAPVPFDLGVITWVDGSGAGEDAVFVAATGGGTGTQDLLSEDFEDPVTWHGIGDPATITDKWVVTLGPGQHTAGEWVRAAAGAQGQPSGSSGYFAVSDSDDAGTTSYTSSILYSPVMDLGSVLSGPVTLELDLFYNYYSSGGSEHGEIDVWDGSGWTTVASYTTVDVDEHVTLDVTGHALGNSEFRIRFSYQDANYDWWFSFDNLRVIVPVTPVCDNTTDCSGLFADGFESGDMSQWSASSP